MVCLYSTVLFLYTVGNGAKRSCQSLGLNPETQAGR